MNSVDDYLIGGDELFNEPRFINHFEYMLDDYEPVTDKAIGLFLSCSKHKPYYKSPYRRVFNAMIEKKMNLRNHCQIYTVSEPAIIVPEEFDDTSVTMYDFPPDLLKDKGRKIFIERLANILPKLLKAHKINFYILPKHHRGIFESALEMITKDMKDTNLKIIYAPPLTYNLPKARKIIEDNLETEKLVNIIR